uniref:UPF0505 protein C16orf62 homolog isoform X8 n=1 Tax=Nicotiana sylvestris TaxID=4096 RepID=A0A1U7W5I3_NICSY|nr:PREDICTED: UPF0505 protein C16orf62 homolog isoform X8 [Nicotiana sylvestris]
MDILQESLDAKISCLQNDFCFFGTEKPSANAHLEELDDPQRFAEGVKYITLQEYVSRLTELKDEISRAWHANDRVTSFNLSIKVAKLLSDTSVLQFYPTLFVLATEILDMLGDMVWERIRQKAEYTEDGTLVHLPGNFRATEICAEAKETCYNWFFKVGSIRELLPRIYLELAIFHCWRFLLQKPADNLPRLVMMARGIADPLVSFYCCLYLAHCAQKLPQRDIGHLIISMNDMNTLLMNGAHVASVEKTSGVLSGNRSSKLGLMEPAIEYVMKCLFRESCELQVGEILMGLGLGRNQSELFGNSSCISLVLHHLLKELPIEIIFSNALDILHLIECSYDYSFDQCLNFKLLGLRLCENISQVNEVNLVMKKVIQVVSRFNSLDEYLNVVDAHIDIALQKHMHFTEKDSNPDPVSQMMIEANKESARGHCLQNHSPQLNIKNRTPPIITNERHDIKSTIKNVATFFSSCMLNKNINRAKQ